MFEVRYWRCNQWNRQVLLSLAASRLTSSFRGLPALIFATLAAGCRSSPSTKGTPYACAMPSPTVDLLCGRTESEGERCVLAALARVAGSAYPHPDAPMTMIKAGSGAIVLVECARGSGGGETRRRWVTETAAASGEGAKSSSRARVRVSSAWAAGMSLAAAEWEERERKEAAAGEMRSGSGGPHSALSARRCVKAGSERVSTF